MRYTTRPAHHDPLSPALLPVATLAPEGELEAVRAEHEKVLRGRFPMLPEVTIDHTWTGYVLPVAQ